MSAAAERRPRRLIGLSPVSAPPAGARVLAWLGSIALHLCAVAIGLFLSLDIAPEPLEIDPIPVSVVDAADLEQALRQAAIASAEPAPAVQDDAEPVEAIGDAPDVARPAPAEAVEAPQPEIAEAPPPEPAPAPPPEVTPPPEPEIAPPPPSAEAVAPPPTPEAPPAPTPEPAPVASPADPSPEPAADQPPPPPLAKPRRPTPPPTQQAETPVETPPEAPNLLSSILDDLREATPGRPSPRAGGAADGPALSGGEKDAIRGCLEEGWFWDPGVPFPETLQVILLVTLNEEAQVIDVKPETRAYLRDRFYERAFRQARNAVYACDFAKVAPPEKFATWRQMRLRFDPSGIFN